MRIKKKPLIITLSAVAALTAAAILSLTVSPVPAALLLRKLFENPTLAPPNGYAAMEETVTAHLDLDYPSAYADHTLDLYLPETADGNLPVVLWVHGGGYVGGDKSDVRYYATALASNGYAVISMNYQRAPEAKYPVPIVQIGEVVRWMVSAAERYSLDPNRLVLAGDSAGAHSAATFSLIQTNPDYAEKSGFTATLPADALKGLLLYCGPYDVPLIDEIPGIFGFMLARAGWAYFGARDWAAQYGEIATVRHHVTTQYPPTFITDSGSNSFEIQGKALADTLERAAVPVTRYFMPADTEKTTHEYQFLMNTPAGAECYRLTLQFLAAYMHAGA